ncbi:TetR/AcrR family transcriptional regulator [Streptomyces sp. ISL-44]|uniref:TetR/AcrR family transcriptional regulator n=1 Tax=Streptomyces sp. ISL-44 TaxID=2819184 RepID=UPI001BE86179|nr:TetR/AcrR family transcriptional regulator [Streptomyces sp. ISL-44]MBT2541284.1 TetR/AcrR family transcriptional regulator [Streptomyces sp. ISL-44]
MADGRVERGNRTRRTVLDRTVAIASVDGLEGLSLGKIAADLGLSKSGVFALFGSKEDLQLATVRAAVDVFVEEVVRPVRHDPAGVAKVWRVCERWLGYSARRVFPGGCFFCAVSAEFDARPGPVRDEIAKVRSDWTRYIERVLDEARLTGGLRDGADAADVPQLAFEVIALMELANAHSVLHDDPMAYERAARGILDRLRAVAATPEELPQRPPASAGDRR